MGKNLLKDVLLPLWPSLQRWGNAGEELVAPFSNLVDLLHTMQGADYETAHHNLSAK